MIYQKPDNGPSHHYLYHGTPDKLFIPSHFDPAQCELGLWLTDKYEASLAYRQAQDPEDRKEAEAGGKTLMEFYETLNACFPHLSKNDHERAEHVASMLSVLETLESSWSVEETLKCIDGDLNLLKALREVLDEGLFFPGRTLIVEVEGDISEVWAPAGSELDSGKIGYYERSGSFRDCKYYCVYDFSKVKIVGEVL